MKLYEIYFSPTGGTKKVADIISRQFVCEKTEVDLTDADMDFSGISFEEEDICLTAVPSYGGRVPEAAIERLKVIHGNGARVVLTVVYGNRAYEDTLAELKETMETAGFRCFAGIAAVAEHSIMRQFAAGRPDAQDERELISFGEEIKKALEENTADKLLQVPGNLPGREYHGVPFKPKGDKKCTGCGLCAASCPVKAIPVKEPSATDEKKCISCMRCVAVCPNHARDLNKLLLFASAKAMEKACGGRKENELFL